jgi:hypothetical protein
MELQNEPGFGDRFRQERSRLGIDSLIAFLSKQRNIVVYQRMLVPDSRCTA